MHFSVGHDGAQMTMQYESTWNLLIAYAYPRGSLGSVGKQIIMDMLNQNLSLAQKELSKLHFRCGHMGFSWIQWIVRK